MTPIFVIIDKFSSKEQIFWIEFFQTLWEGGWLLQFQTFLNSCVLIYWGGGGGGGVNAFGTCP